MTKYAVSVRVQEAPVMCDTVEASTASEAREICRDKFLSDPDSLRAAMPSMNEMNRQAAEKLLDCMMKTRHEALVFGMTIVARVSKARN